MNVKNIKTKKDLVEFIAFLKSDLTTNKDNWENNNLEDFLCAMESWLEDSDGFEKNLKINLEEINQWQLIAIILEASKIYE